MGEYDVRYFLCTGFRQNLYDSTNIDTQQLNAEPACLRLMLVELYVWPQFTNPKLRANSPRPLVGKPTSNFMVAWTI